MPRDAGTELRKALGLPEPNYGPGYRNPHWFGGYRSQEDWDDARARGLDDYTPVSDEEIDAEKASKAQARAA